MSRRKLTSCLALIALMSLGTAGAASARSAKPKHITVCYNARTHVARYSGSGVCAPGVRRVVIGRGETGARGPLGPRGPRGAIGMTGATGAAGATGSSGPTGPTGGSGVNVFHRVTSAPLSTDGTITALCAAGEVVTGGGFTGSTIQLFGSAPNASGTGWSVTIDSDGSAFVAHAICVVGTSS